MLCPEDLFELQIPGVREVRLSARCHVEGLSPTSHCTAFSLRWRSSSRSVSWRSPPRVRRSAPALWCRLISPTQVGPLGGNIAVLCEAVHLGHDDLASEATTVAGGPQARPHAR